MSTYQIIWLIILIPLFFIYGLIEIRRGWRIIKYQEDSYNLAIQIRLWLAEKFFSDKVFANTKNSLSQNKEYMLRRGYYSFIGGIVSLAASIIWIILLYINAH